MGAWGPAIFSDDLAADIRGDWREAILDGMTPEAATTRVLESHADSLQDEDERVVVWLALAAAQEQTGRLQPEIRDRALEIVDGDLDAPRWVDADPSTRRKRRQAVDALAGRLRGSPRPPTRMARPAVLSSPLEIGDVIRLPSATGARHALFVVVGIAEAYPPGSTQPVVATLLWDRPGLPEPRGLEHLPLLLDEPLAFPSDGAVVSLFALYSTSRGKTAMPRTAEMIARDVRRPDAPDYRDHVKRRGPVLGYTSWGPLMEWLDSDGYSRQVELTVLGGGRRRRWWR